MTGRSIFFGRVCSLRLFPLFPFLHGRRRLEQWPCVFSRLAQGKYSSRSQKSSLSATHSQDKQCCTEHEHNYGRSHCGKLPRVNLLASASQRALYVVTSIMAFNHLYTAYVSLSLSLSFSCCVLSPKMICGLLSKSFSEELRYIFIIRLIYTYIPLSLFRKDTARADTSESFEVVIARAREPLRKSAQNPFCDASPSESL